MGIKYNEAKQYYEVSYSRRHPQTKKSRNIKRIGIKTKAEATKVYKQIQNELLRRFFESTHPYWKDIVEEFILYFTNLGMNKNTVLNYKSSLRAHTLKLWNGKRVNEITSSDIRDLIIDNLSEYSEAHRKNMFKYIKAVFRYSLEKNYITKDPCPKLKFTRNEKIKKVLTENELRKLLLKSKELDFKWFPVWALACYTGMRNGELFALRWDRVDLDRRIIVVCEAWTRQDGFKSTKSGDDRSVEIATSLIPTLKELYLSRTDEFVLPRLKGWATGAQSEILKKFLASINLPIIRFHDIRASWATVMLSKGIEPIKIMSMGGWKDLKTMQIYVRKSGIHIRGITDSLDLFRPNVERL